MKCRWQSLKGRFSLVVDASCSDEVDKSPGKHVHTPGYFDESHRTNTFNNLSLALLMHPRLFSLT